MKKVLMLGGTGAMGIYLSPILLNLGYDVYVTTRKERESNNPHLNYLHGNAQDDIFLKKTLEYCHYDAIIDFMNYSTNKFNSRYEFILKNTHHYFYLSSCRVFSETDEPITENTPKLLDVSNDSKYLKTDEYALSKARQEKILYDSSYKNWTIIRPSITYSTNRFQLGTLEADTIFFRANSECPVILPSEMMYKRTSMTWGADVAKMISALILKQEAFREDYNVVSHEFYTWEYIYQLYHLHLGLKLVTIDLNDYINIVGGKYQVLYSRMFDRVMDNTKILNATGIRKDDLTQLAKGLSKEIMIAKDNIPFSKVNYRLNAKIDKITNSRIKLKEATVKQKLFYYTSYFGFDILFVKLMDFFKHMLINIGLFNHAKRLKELILLRK